MVNPSYASFTRVPDAARAEHPSGVDLALLAPAANACAACGKSDGKLLLCGRCRGVWFCNRKCQDVARKELGHRGVNCRPADGAQKSDSSANARAPVAAPSRPSTLMERENLCHRFTDLTAEAQQAQRLNTRVGYLAAAEIATELAMVADLIGGAVGAACHSQAELLQSGCLLPLGNKPGAARAACSSLLGARASGIRSALVKPLIQCGDVASVAAGDMANAERESREQERLCGSPSHGGLDLSQEGQVSLPTTPAAFSRLGLAYYEAALATCDAALAAVGGRDDLADDDEPLVPALCLEGRVRGSLGFILHRLGEQQRGSELLRQAVALVRHGVRKAAPGSDALVSDQRMLATTLLTLSVVLDDLSMGDSRDAPGFGGVAEAVACLREALELCADTDSVMLKQTVLGHLANMSGRPDMPVGPAEAAAFRSRLNALYAQAGRNHDTNCTICLESLEQPDGGADQDTADHGDRDADHTNSAVLVLSCGHQFHQGCLFTWWRTAASRACPLCKE